jgi:RNA polymerase sigma-70 factor (ECF subfamily)
LDTPDQSRLTHVQENFVRHVVALRGFVLGLVPQRHMTDDIVQETFLTACQKAETYEPGTNFRAWIFTIARFKVLATLKRQAGKNNVLSSDVVEVLAAEHVEDVHLPARVAALDQCVAKLGPSARRAVTLRYVDNLGPTEIASVMGWSVNSLNVALSRARLFLRSCVERALQHGEGC